MKPRVIITMGDPAGVGPEVTLKALASPAVSGLADFFVVGDGSVVSALYRGLGLRLKAPLVDLRSLKGRSVVYGKESPAMGAAAIRYLDEGLRLIARGKGDCLVTAPVNKSSIRMSGLKRFEGHTEYLAERTHSRDVAMMFVGKGMKITLVTRHIALKDVPKRLTTASIYRAIRLTDTYLKKFFKVRYPRIAVAGLNPHAGENGSFGKEEDRIIRPAIRKAAGGRSRVSGPYPPDVVFHDALNRRFDAVVSMYHDQALIPFKLLYFTDGVNLTLGLPFVRTSPDHGTAFDIAGKGSADPGSMIEAIRLACRLAAKA